MGNMEKFVVVYSNEHGGEKPFIIAHPVADKRGGWKQIASFPTFEEAQEAKARYEWEYGSTPGFAINEGKGFQIRFKRGVMVSVQFGYGNDCDNYNPAKNNQENPNLNTVCANAEVAVFKYDENITARCWHDLEGVKLEGFSSHSLPHVSPQDVARIIAWAAQEAKNKNEQKEEIES